jgi:hypothetical protein
MKICEVFLVEYSRPLNALDKVSIAELVQFTHFDPNESVTTAAAADRSIREEWKFEVDDHELNFLDWRSLQIFFKDGSSIKLKTLN